MHSQIMINSCPEFVGLVNHKRVYMSFVKSAFQCGNRGVVARQCFAKPAFLVVYSG